MKVQYIMLFQAQTYLIKTYEGDEQAQICLCESATSDEALLAQDLLCLVQRGKHLTAHTTGLASAHDGAQTSFTQACLCCRKHTSTIRYKDKYA